MSNKHTNRPQHKYSKNRNGQPNKSYHSEFSNELGMQVYYKPRSLSNNQRLPETPIETNYLNEFILKIVDSHLWKYPDAMVEFKTYINALFHTVDSSIWVDDMTHYVPIRNEFMKISEKHNIQSKLGEETTGGIDRGNNRVKSIEKYVLRKQSGTQISPTCYLDVGCFDGSISSSIAKYFNLNKLQAHGVDIKSYDNAGGYSNITFSQYDGRILPYSNKSFDLITCLMVLHHIPDNNLNILMSEINRVMKPNGVVIIREHDVSKDVERTSLDVMHHFYDYVWSNDNKTMKPGETNWVTNYKSNTEWSEIFLANGFVSNTSASVYRNTNVNPFMSYICSYRKPYHVDNTYSNNIYRIIPDDLPRELYKRHANKSKNVIHWGQRKLLLTEIEFFTIFLMNNTNLDTPIYAVYAGSAPGTHILYLSKLFPTIHFELYDPRDFSNKLLKNKEKITTHIQYFTDETAGEWISSNHPDKTILLISDVRTGDPEKQTPEKLEECVKIDHEWQQTWYHIIKPEMAMFKFRLPWDDEKTEYLSGDIYIQPYPPATSTETRLIVGKDAGVKTYDNRKYEEQLFHFNNYVRPTEFNNTLFNTHSNHKSGLSNDFNSAVEVYILGKYLQLHNIEQTGQEDFVNSKIINMAGAISRELSYSRTLYSPQPIKEHKKKILNKLQNLGYVPKNIELNQVSFDKYVISRYDFFKSEGLLD
jgi:SAM-dependent methyltransferase